MTRFGMFGVAFLAASSAAFALPKATELVDQMGFGINIGNTMEVPISSSCANMSCWGNELPTKTYVDAIKAAGFNSVRIPCAWYTHTTDKDSMTIASTFDLTEDAAYMIIQSMIFCSWVNSASPSRA